MKKKITFVLIGLFIIYAVYFVGSGFMINGNALLTEYQVSPNEKEITLDIGVMASIGYTRKIKNVSKDPEKMMLKCYSAFGGINGSIGAENRFVVPLSSECEEIYLYSFGEYRLIIFKDETTGEWKRTKY